ncbi:MAG: hypothetical protein P9F75_07290 [Candidatus Contendobacter sp.]|nr:hypothetical protein [Candidatus Contendobacter sp.]
MTALTADRNTPSRSGDLIVLTVYGDAATTIYAGSLVCATSAGRAVPGGHAQAARAIGRAEEQVANPLGGTKTVTVRRGVFQFGGDGIGDGNVGRMAYVVDDQTVGGYDDGRICAGRIVGVDSSGVWVAVGETPIPAGIAPLAGTLTGTVDGALADIAAIALSTAGGNTYSDAAVNAAVNAAITSANLQIKELQTTLNAVIAALGDEPLGVS